MVEDLAGGLDNIGAHLTGHDLGGTIASGDAEIGSTAVFERSLGPSMRDHAGRGRSLLAADT
jgi:hypothetical protein